MKKILKIIGVLIAIIIVATGIYYIANTEALPKGVQGKEAEELAEKMMSAINKRAFDSAEILEWSFRGKHHYVWKKTTGIGRCLLG